MLFTHSNEWGVNGDHRTHSNFRAKAIDQVLKIKNCFGRTGDVNYEQLRSDDSHQQKPFPEKYLDAIRYVLESELKGGDTIHVTRRDKLGMNCQVPYYRCKSKKDGRVVGYRQRDGFRKYQHSDLDPMSRFRWVILVDQAEIWFRRWYLKTDEEMLGTVFEAVFCCYAIYNAPCFHCKCSNCLRWLGGSQAAWQDLVCTVCNSTFEIKTKRNLDMVEASFQRNSFQGGSFKEYHRIQNAI